MPPRWYILLRAARHIGVPPWELEKMPMKWLKRAIASEACENWSEGEIQKKHKQLADAGRHKKQHRGDNT